MIWGGQTSDYANYSNGDYFPFIAITNSGKFHFYSQKGISSNAIIDKHLYTSKLDVSYNIKFTWHDTGEVIDTSFYQSGRDLDIYVGVNKLYEGWSANKADFNKFYVYEGNKLTVKDNSDTLYFGCLEQGSSVETDTTEDQYKITGVIGATNNGEWNGTIHLNGECDNTLEVYSDYINIESPVKTETSTGSNPDGSYAIGDEAEFTISQKMGTFFVDTFTTYESFSISDVLPSGLTYQSAVLLNGETDVTDSVGSLSYDSSSREVRFEFNEDYLEDRDNYTGQTFKLVITTTVDDTSDLEKDIENNSYTYVSGLEYGPATETITVKRPQLSIEKVSDDTSYSLTDDVTYTIVVNETADNAPAKNVIVSDKVPDELTLVSVDAEGADVKMNGNNSFTATYDEIAFNDPKTIIVTTTSNKEGSNIVNTATATADYTDEVSSDRSVIVQKPELTIKKNTDAEEYYPGDTVTFTIDVENVKEDPNAYDVVVSDEMPEGLELIDVTEDGLNGKVEKEDNSFTVTYEKIAYQEKSTITITAKVDEKLGNTTLTNIATLSGKNIDETMDYAEVNVIKPILSIEKSSDKENYSVGGEIVYDIIVKQTQEDLTAYNVSVEDKLPAATELKEVTLDGVEGSINMDGNSFTIDIPELAFGETASIKVTATAVSESDEIINVASVTADHADPEDDDTSSKILTPALKISKETSEDEYFMGDNFTYEIQVEQTVENAESYDVVVNDTLPEGMELIDVSSADGTIEKNSNSFTVAWDVLPAGELKTITVEVVANESGKTLKNTAIASSSNTAEVSDSTDVWIMNPILTIEKEADRDEVYAGEAITYTIKVTQEEEGTVARDVIITDEIPSGLTVDGSATLEGVSGDVVVDGNKVTVSIPRLSDSEEAVVTVRTIAGADLSGKDVINTATVSADHVDPTSDDASTKVNAPVASEVTNNTPTSTTSSAKGDAVKTSDYTAYIALAIGIMAAGVFVLIKTRRKA